MHFPTKHIEDIVVGSRFRKELGNLKPLAESIEQVGLLHPIVITPNGELIAGQRRLEACKLLGWNDVPVTVIDLEAIVIGEAHENFLRKDLLPSEIVAIKRAMEPYERKEARQRQGHKAAFDVEKKQGDTRDRIAHYLGIGRTTIEKAEAVVDAAEECPEEYSHLVEQMDRSGKVAGAYRKLIVEQQAKRLIEEPPEFPTGKFHVIVADPPWRYQSGNNLPYPTMDLEEIKALPVASIAEDDSVLWLWTTNAHLRVAFEVVDAWGFEYKTTLTWVKDRMGTGDWLRGQTEHCLLAARGKPVIRLTTQTTVLEAPRREHSRKPQEFFDIVGTICPGQKVELFSRESRSHWQAFGLHMALVK